MPPSSAQAYQALTDYQKTRQTPDQVVSTANDKYGVSGIGGQLTALRTLTGNLQNSIRNVDPSVTGRTSGSDVTEAQRSAIVNHEQAPLVDQFNTTQQNANDVSHQYDQATGLATSYANSLMEQDRNKYNELFTGYNTALSGEQNAAKMAEEKRQFDAQLAESQAQRRAAAAAAAGLSLGGRGGSGSSAPVAVKPATPQDHLTADIARLITPDYATKFGDGYTERQIQRLQQAYPEIPPAQIAQSVYAYRKQYEPKQAAKPAPAPKIQSNGSGAIRSLNGWAGTNL